MIAFQVSRRRRSTYQRNKADPSWLCHFGVASLGRRHGKLHQGAISAPADGGLLHAPFGQTNQMQLEAFRTSHGDALPVVI